MQNRTDRIFVRPAAPDDLPQLCELLALLFAQEADFEPDVERQSRGLRLILEQPEFGRIFCATDGVDVVGMASILFIPSTAMSAVSAWLEDMVVHPHHRGRGIGGRLLQEAINQARAAGCARITLLTDAINASAMRFYGRAGFIRSPMIPWRLGL